MAAKRTRRGKTGGQQASAPAASLRPAADRPPDCLLDLGNGEAMVVGTAADHRLAAEWLERHYPDGPPGERTGPVRGPVLNSNYRVRQVLALGEMPGRHLRLLIALATFLPDDTRTVRLGFDAVIETTGNSHNTVRRARRELAMSGQIGYEPGKHRGHLTLWTICCLPEKGASTLGTLPAAGKGTNPGLERVPTGRQKGYQPQRADQQEPERGLNLPAKSSSPRTHASDMLRAIDPGVTEEEATEVVKILAERPTVRDPVAVLSAEIVKGNGYALIYEARHRLDRAQWNGNGQPPAPGPQQRPWCGNCDEHTKQREDDQGRPYRCPDCHPKTASQAAS